MKLVVVLAAALVLAPVAGARIMGSGPTRVHVASATPTGLHAFLLRADEPAQKYYSRTPSFSWNPVSTKGTYDFELATSRSFNDASVLFSYTKLKIPAVAIAHQLPWMTGVPYALWAHVRWESADGKVVTPWSVPLGFNMRWTDNDYPQQLSAPEGLIRWKPIEGATRYEVLYPDIGGTTSFQTTTNVADEREFFTFHNSFGYATIHWRVRAVRYIDDKDLLKNGIPRVSYGPWSKTFTTVNPPQSLGALTPTDTVSDTWDKKGHPASPHELTPGFAWSPSAPVTNQYVGSVGSSLYRVYIFTDDHCVNTVFTGSIVGSPAFAPRTVGGVFNLPQDTTTLSSWTGAPYLIDLGGTEGHSYDAAGHLVKPNESAGSAVSTNTSLSGTATSTGDAAVDLWDSGWPNGRYYWTVVPVRVEPFGVADAKTASLPLEYHDTAVPQDQCESGLGMSFGKVSEPVVTAAGTPWVSGLAPNGRVVASASKLPTVHDSPLVAWEPAVGATTYEVQLSRRSYPWKVTWSTTTPATSLVLPLGSGQTGTWWYRVRGIDPALPSGAQAMSWSKSVPLRITGDRFVVVK
ncbi:MAG TPA: hypothetical protein VGQ38_12325 [Gaiellaceae bacterium]|nr:hypothetical protein [Gaiellaceae bacterium]